MYTSSLPTKPHTGYVRRNRATRQYGNLPICTRYIWYVLVFELLISAYHVIWDVKRRYSPVIGRYSAAYSMSWLLSTHNDGMVGEYVPLPALWPLAKAALPTDIFLFFPHWAPLDVPPWKSRTYFTTGSVANGPHKHALSGIVKEVDFSCYCQTE